jgi:scyllo-inositol 2-dehydrogenase (NADP+)
MQKKKSGLETRSLPALFHSSTAFAASNLYPPRLFQALSSKLASSKLMIHSSLSACHSTPIFNLLSLPSSTLLSRHVNASGPQSQETTKMSQREIGVAVVGYGLGGRVFHAPFVSAVPGLNLRSIFQRSGDSAAKAYPNVTIARSIDPILDDKSIDLVVVSTPNETHFDLARQALEAGKHVVIDKPFAATSEQALVLGSIAKLKGVLVIPFHNRRWDGDFLTIKKLLADNTLGRLVTFETNMDRFRPLPREHKWKESENPANGMLFDLGPHLVDQLLALFGTPEAITASVRADRDHTAIEDAFDITLHYPSYTTPGKSLRARASASYLACDASPRFLMHGTRGSFRKYGLDPQEATLESGAKLPPMGSQQPWLKEPASQWGTLTIAPDPASPTILVTTQVETLPGDYRNYYAQVRDAILGSTPPALTAEDGYRVIKLLELARESSLQRRTLPVVF